MRFLTSQIKTFQKRNNFYVKEIIKAEEKDIKKSRVEQSEETSVEPKTYHIDVGNNKTYFKKPVQLVSENEEEEEEEDLGELGQEYTLTMKIPILINNYYWIISESSGGHVVRIFHDKCIFIFFIYTQQLKHFNV